MSQLQLFEPDIFGLEDSDLIQEATAVSVIDAAGGEIVGRIRLQKIVYLLDKLGLGSNFEYTYHHYGPYSAELSDAMDFAKAFGLVEEKISHRTSDGARYSSYHAKSSLKHKVKSVFFASDNIKQAIRHMNSSSSTVLEVAATAYWLLHDEQVPNWRAEIVRRKGSKTDNGRLDQAIELLKSIGLEMG